MVINRSVAWSWLVMACMALAAPQVLRGQQYTPVHLAASPGVVPASFFGMHIHRPGPQTWPQVPFAEWRLWDSTNTVWYLLEPRPGMWNFSQLDADVAMAEQHKVGLLLTLGRTAPWATMRPNDPPPWLPGGAAPPRNEEDWKTYVRTVAIRYQGRIQAYEIWNEPNLKESYTGTPEQLVALAKDAYSIIHEVDPRAVVVSPGVIGDYGLSWFNRYLDLGGGRFADVIAYHFYTGGTPERSAQIIRQVRDSMQKHGIDKPLWNTESGWVNQSQFEDVRFPEGSGKRVITSEEALAYVMRSYLLDWASGVSRLYWYDWDSNRAGLGDNMGRQKKPAACGYITIEQWLVGASLLGCDQDATGDWTCRLDRRGRTEWIIWNPDESVPRHALAIWSGKHLDTLNSAGTLTSSLLSSTDSVSFSPIPSRIY
jgi:hypothetical protein